MLLFRPFTAIRTLTCDQRHQPRSQYLECRCLHLKAGNMSLPAIQIISTLTGLPNTQEPTDRAEQHVDARFKRLKAQVLPESPYILHVRSTHRQSPEHADHWQSGTPFDLNEEELQYLTFKDRTNDLTPGLLCRGGWDDGKGGLAPPEEPYSRTSSDGTPVQGQGHKKKISLADYNRRDKKKAAVTAAKNTNPRTREQPQDNAAVEEFDANVTGSKPGRFEQHGQKRYALLIIGT